MEKKLEKKDDKIKYDIIAELGLFDKVMKYGWKSLTAKETGRIGGLITKRKRLYSNDNKEQAQ
ncbi:MAG: small, acid-soluble spore protein, alpha/beta type [Bacillota bacterium]|nr:small, acid-soluble spore protein, alpha/beta type [Bacillota bacterium]